MNLKNKINLYEDKFSAYRRFKRWKIYRKLSIDKCLLTSDQIKKIKCLYSPYHKIGMHSHSFYTQKTGVFSEYYIPDELWYAYIEPHFNPRAIAKAMDSKVLYDRLLRGGVKHPVTIASKINGYWVSDDYEPTSISQIVAEAMKFSHIFVKQAEDSAGGHGVTHFKMPDEKTSLEKTLCESDCNVVVQMGLKQHDTMAVLNPSSVNTIRFLSYIDRTGDVKILSTVVRMGRNGTFVDNASSGGLTVGVSDNGTLKGVGFDVKGTKYYEHPDTHIKFSDITIPNYEKIYNLIKKECWKLTQFRLLSWDIAIDYLGNPVLIEVNMHSGQLDFHQLNNGPVFGKYTEAVLNEVFG